MKHFLRPVLAALFCALTAASCASRQTVVEADTRCDSLVSVVNAKDSLLARVFEDVSVIADNLALIRTREGLIAAAADAEQMRRPVEEIGRDIEAIDRLLQENRAKIASLQHVAAQLRKANLRIEGLEKMIDELRQQLDIKRTEVAELRDRLADRETQVAELAEQVAVRTAEVEELSDEKVGLESQLNAVYYIVGSEKELREAQIVDKQGFIGRTLTVRSHGSFESFTPADARLLEEVPVGYRRVKVVTPHPEDSYKLVVDADKVVTKLLILDPGRFWESSKMLIVSYR